MILLHQTIHSTQFAIVKNYWFKIHTLIWTEVYYAVIDG